MRPHRFGFTCEETDRVSVTFSSPVSLTPTVIRSGTASPMPPTVARSDARSSSDPWDFDMLPSTSTSGTASPVAAPATRTRPSHAKQDSWGIDFGELPSAKAAADPLRQAPVPRRPEGSSSLLGFDEEANDSEEDDDFGFGPSAPRSRRGAPTSLDDHGASDDILGDLGKPMDADAIRRQAAELLDAEANRRRGSRHPASPPQNGRAPRAGGATSPPPHVLGQVVEMGFGIGEARAALISTQDPSGGWNVEAAVGSLVGQGGAGAGPALDEPARPSNGGDRRRRQRPHQSAFSDDDERHDPVLGRRQGTLSPGGAGPSDRSASPSVIGGVNTKELSDQASVLLAQASAYGTSALGRASAFWKQGRAAIEKALEDREMDGEGSGRRRTDGPAADTRPKWMKEAERAERLAREQGEGSASPQASRSGPKHATFRDDSDDEGPAPPPRARPNGRDRPTPVREPSPDLFGGGSSAPAPQAPPAAQPTERQPYVSSARRRGPDRSQRPAPSTPTPVSQPKPSRPPRSLPAPSASQLASSNRLREKGNEAFKRGQFGDAEVAYGGALDALPEGCWERLSALNNRAMARLKTGDGKGVGDDATEAIVLIVGCSVSIAQPGGKLDLSFIEVDAAVVPAGTDLRDQLGKALSRRARASEARERWSDAAKDWETLRGAGEAVIRSAGGAKVVTEGVARCRKLADGDGATSPAAAASRPRPKAPARPPPRPAVSSQPSEAVTRLQNAHAAAEVEAAERLSLKDSVDGRILAWKGGKETNLRALIASLDMVLWPELGWKKVGMGELLSEGQVKSRYVRAIAKVHPDKVGQGFLQSSLWHRSDEVALPLRFPRTRRSNTRWSPRASSPPSTKRGSPCRVDRIRQAHIPICPVICAVVKGYVRKSGCIASRPVETTLWKCQRNKCECILERLPGPSAVSKVRGLSR